MCSSLYRNSRISSFCFRYRSSFSLFIRIPLYSFTLSELLAKFYLSIFVCMIISLFIFYVIQYLWRYIMQNIKIPSHFTIIQNRECVLEFKSQFHYWRITENYGLYILAHKYQKSHSYHKQCSGTDPNALLRYTVRHDSFFATMLNS